MGRRGQPEPAHGRGALGWQVTQAPYFFFLGTLCESTRKSSGHTTGPPNGMFPKSGDRALRPDWGMLRRSFPPRKAHSGGGGRVWFVYQPASLNNRRENHNVG